MRPQKIVFGEEEPKASLEIFQLVKKAFETAEVKDGDEQDYVTKLRSSIRHIRSLR